MLLAFFGAVCFALAHPGFLFSNGVPVCAWIMWAPAFFIVRRSSFRTVWLWGGFYGVLSYVLFVSWVVTFSTVAATAVCFEYFLSYALLFLALKIADSFCGRHMWLAQFFILCAHEYGKTLGFAGFSYGVSGYTQWQNSVLLQSASLFGVWTLTFLIDFFSAWIYCVLLDVADLRNGASGKSIVRSFFFAAKAHAFSLCVWICCLCFVVAYGVFALSHRKRVEKFVKVCAIQHNTDPWRGGIAAYEQDVKTLMRLTDEALSENPDIALVVWPETSVVPSILTHYALRHDRRRFDLVNAVLQFIDSKNAVFVIGNFHAVDTGKGRTDDYNSAFLFTPRKNVIPPEPEIYRKMHLVPFTESVPFAESLPRLRALLEKADTHLWQKGNVRTVFTAAGISFSVPICFEDTFGNDCRKFVNAGARAFVNMSNDAWSKSLSCQNQHLAMAVFRCVENRVPAVRSTASGQTCIIDTAGAVLQEAAPFTQTYVTGLLEVAGSDAGNTLYDKIGDALAVLFVVAAVVLNAVCIIWNKKEK